MGSLFDEDYSLQASVEKKLQPLYPALWLSCVLPFQSVQRRREENDPEFMHLQGDDLAWWLHTQMVERATHFVSKHHPEVLIRQKKSGSSQMFCLVVDNVIISLKKLNPSLSRSNYRTKNQRTYWGKNNLFNDDSVAVIFGYQLVKAETEMKLFLTCPQGRKNLWSVPIPDQTDLALKLIELAPTHGSVEERKGFHVEPIPKRGATGEVG